MRSGRLEWATRPWHLVPLLLITLVNAGCAMGLELYADEAYYWTYSRQLDAGYFDHPPMVAWLIWLGTLVISNELGVRLVFVMLTTATYSGLYRLIQPRLPWFFWGVLFSLFPLHLIGFMALPDVPLLFFTVVFLLVYRHYLHTPGWSKVLLLSIAVAGMLYSKYHGVLIIFFTLVSNPSLLQKKSFYGVVLLSFGLLIPHLIWLWDHDWVSVTYHLFERPSSPFKWQHPIHFLISFILFNGPFLFIVLVTRSWRRSWIDPFEKALFLILTGFFSFFLLMSLKGRVEANWTLPVLISAVFLGFARLRPSGINQGLVGISLALFLTFRIFLLFPGLFTDRRTRGLEFHGHREWALKVSTEAGTTPVLAERYQEAALLAYYLQRPASVYPVEGQRKSQFDLWKPKIRAHSYYHLKREKFNSDCRLHHPYYGCYSLILAQD